MLKRSPHLLPRPSPLATWLLLLLLALLAPLPATALQVRVATYNIENGTGTTDSPKFAALSNTLYRINADIICFQELQSSTFDNWQTLADGLGYDYTATSTLGPFAGSHYTGYYSRYPIVASTNITSPPDTKELTRSPFRVTIQIPGAKNPLVLWNMHHKASDATVDKFRRSVEAYRIIQDINAYCAANPTHTEYIFAGDLNADCGKLSGTTPTWFNEPPASTQYPQTWVLGSDIPFPLRYAVFPTQCYANAGQGLVVLDPTHEGYPSRYYTRPASENRLDYVFLSPALHNSSLGAPQSEVYYSATDAGGGLPKRGSPLPAGASTNSSDHLPIIVDIHMADATPAGVTTHGVPIAWYQSFGLTPPAGKTWNDLDTLPSASGTPYWQQYYAGLNPTDPTALFMFQDITLDTGQTLGLEWFGGTHGPATPYTIQATTNLINGTWTTITTVPRQNGAHTWTNALPSDQILYYRLWIPLP